jgi:hypothetical protein
MERRSAENAMNGLSTRIPFLKCHLCKLEGPSGESVWSEPRRLDKTALPGHAFTLKAGPLVLFRMWHFYEDIARFNGANASIGGVQALKTIARREFRYIVAPCDTVHLGDLRLSTILDSQLEDVLLAGKAGEFNPSCYGVILRRDQSSKDYILHHELEHAQHFSLWHLAGFPAVALGTARAEYLSLLRELADFGNASSFLPYVSQLFPQDFNLGFEPTYDHSHNAASFFFLQRLLGRYHMDKDDVMLALIWTLRDEYRIQSDVDIQPRCAEQFVRMRNAAIGEYNETYTRMFGMTIDDLREVVSRLSM